MPSPFRPAPVPSRAPEAHRPSSAYQFSSTVVGVIASRASVGGAVERNRAKRRLRELYRRHQHLVPPGFDLILTARAAVLRLEFADLEKKFVEACRRFAPKTTAP